jgi:hypothetical protein
MRCRHAAIIPRRPPPAARGGSRAAGTTGASTSWAGTSRRRRTSTTRLPRSSSPWPRPNAWPGSRCRTWLRESGRRLAVLAEHIDARQRGHGGSVDLGGVQASARPSRCWVDDCGNPGQVCVGGDVRTVIRSPGRLKMLRISAGCCPVLPNQCGTWVSNSAISPGPRTQSRSPRRSRRWPDRT